VGAQIWEIARDPAPDILQSFAERPVEKTTRVVVKDVRCFRGKREQSDDIPAMAIRWRGLKESTS
jgi:hypothetical protein